MSRDYKYRATTRKRKKKSSPVTWLLTGLAMGGFGALLVFLQMRPDTHQATAGADTTPLEVPQENEVRDVRKDSAKPIPPPPKPRFDFYNVLPEMEVVIPEKEITGAKKQGVKQVEKPGIYLLQAGSFRNLEQADQLKAKLALLGLETRVDSATTNSGKWHRVRVGPYQKLGALNSARSRLKQNGIDAILIKIKK